MAMNHQRRWKAGPVALMLAIIVLQLVAAWALHHAATRRIGLALAVLVIILVIGLNLLRFLAWGYAHRHWPLSHIYPLTALFFPCILLLSWAEGDAVGITEIIGTALITAGACVLASGMRAQGSDHG